MKSGKDLLEQFVSDEEEDASGLSPGKDDNEIRRELGCKDCRVLMVAQY